MIRTDAVPSAEPAVKDRPERGRLAELYRAHAADATRLAYLVTGDRALAEDLAQEAFVKLFGRFRDLRNPEAFPFYLRSTVVNLARSHFRRRRVERSYLAGRGREEAVARAVAQPGDVGARDAMWRELLRLPERQRTAIVLRFYEDLSEAQTADVMACPVGTVKSLVSRGLERLRGSVRRSSEDE